MLMEKRIISCDKKGFPMPKSAIAFEQPKAYNYRTD
jgi:hypothetical protein